MSGYTKEYYEGYNAFWDGVAKNENPQPKGTQQRTDWFAGWNQALQNDRGSLDA